MTKFDQAVVLGGSIAGLLCAAALSPSFGRVTVVDRDELPVDGPDARAPRRGVPHGTQVHHLPAPVRTIPRALATATCAHRTSSAGK